MKSLQKPKKLQPKDRVAIISPSSGLAGEADILWRYEQGCDRLQTEIGLVPVTMPHTLAGLHYVYEHPEKRAEDLMNAFLDDSIKAIICCIGGNDSIRMLPYIDFDVIKAHPKILCGYSDITVLHMMCLKAGISSFYGPSILNDFAENCAMSTYTKQAIQKTWFQTSPIGELLPSETWSAQMLRWEIQNKATQRTFVNNHPYEVLQGHGVVQGRLLGGCLEVLEYCKGTPLFPELSDFDDAILFIETSEVKPEPWLIEDELRSYGIMGIYQRINGIFWGKPQEECYYEEYKQVIRKVLKEFDCKNLPVIYNGSFGHNEPKMILPYGSLAQLDCDHGTVSILDSGVIE